MTANGKKVAEGRLRRRSRSRFSLGEGMDIGMDVGSAVDFTYKLPFAVHGQDREGDGRIEVTVSWIARSRFKIF